MRKNATWRQFLIPRLRRGEITITQAAWIAGVSRQAVMQWCEIAGIRPKEAEHARIMRIRADGERLMRGEPATPKDRRTKAALRDEADQAKRDWDSAHGAD